MQILSILGNFVVSLNGNFSVIVLTESQGDETPNENSLLNLDNYYSVYQTRKNCIYIHKQLEFKLRNDIDISNNKTETFFVEIIKSKSRNFVVKKFSHLYNVAFLKKAIEIKSKGLNTPWVTVSL